MLVTGLGAITSAGLGVAALERALRGSAACFRDVTLFSTEGLRVHHAGQVESVPESELAGVSGRRRASRSDRLALLAVEEALAQSGLDPATLPRHRTGTSIGTSTGGMLETESYFATRLAGTAAGPFRPRLLAATVGATTDLVAARLGALGPRLSPSTACSSSAIAIAMGLTWIRSGAADVVIAGGTDALCRMTYTGFHALQALSPEPCRPFDRDRQGLTLGEGAAILILEAEEHARARGASALGEVLGAGLSCDAAHPTAPDTEGRSAGLALAAALADARVGAGEIGYVNAHGTGTPQNDAAESRVLDATFRGRPVPVSSTKGAIGHLLGAAGAVEAVATLIALAGEFAPATVGLRDPDPECPLDLVRGEARPLSFEIAASNSYGFGGNNVSLVLRRP